MLSKGSSCQTVLGKAVVGSATELHSLTCGGVFWWKFGIMLILKQFVQILVQIFESSIVVWGFQISWELELEGNMAYVPDWKAVLCCVFSYVFIF